TNLGLMFMILLVAAWTQFRITTGMAEAMSKVDVLGNQLTLVLRWRGMVETALTYVVGGAITTDPVLAKRYDAQFKELSATIGSLQEQVIKGATSEEEKKFLEDLSKLRAAAVAHVGKAKEVKANDPAAVQGYVDQQL
ncbi:MCP four helix bundle domain-containing protein, partial [Leptospira sp. SA-E8]|uniref:MCP four helix bundle domain-containing protein n=1 Tax=Leptospira sp. SA-E8 TaxID=3422259 RepID=UPI003EBF3E8B